MSGTIEFSLPNNGDLVIGQSFLFTVTVSCDKDIDDNITISFYNSKNITVPSDDILLILKDNRKKAMVTVTLVVFNSLSENEEIYFSVKTSLNDIQPKTLKYTAKTINSNSLELNIDTVSLVMPESFNDSQIGAISTKVHTVLRDKKGVVLSGVPIFIKSNIIDQLEEVCIYSDDGNLIINIQKFGIYYGFFVNSDNKGKVKFFITPRKSLPLVIELFSIIPNSTDFVSSKNPIFITVDDIQDNRQPLNIITAIDGNLKSEGESKFWVDMSPCEDYKLGDFLLFFVNKEYKYYTK
ncbi:hypothetical protein [Xenorhabdus sp. Sc-CR9]|uniref:hypothetical protein n=1 Tax=Xenorhabdus sp. Sc-CR9 TaxID=2584468 RepID=UPI001F38E7E6|nr:hypothetical protein [Xenorhabdus sp. Sc-CR9]